MSERAGIAIDAVGASAANKSTILGAAVGALGWFAQINWVGLMGVLVAVVGLAFNIYFQARRDRRETAESEARIAALHGACDVEAECEKECTSRTSSRKRQRGAVDRALVGRMSVAALVVAMGGYVAMDEGGGPTTVAATGEVVHHAYPDAGLGWNLPTICQGRTKGVTRGMTATAAQCRQWLERELQAEVVASLVRNVKTAVTFNQAVALGRFRDNVGEGSFRASKLVREVNAGNCLPAAREFNAAPQVDSSGVARVWRGKAIIDRQTGAVLLASGAPIMKWTTANGVPLPGLIKRRADERAMFEADCVAW